MRKRPLLVALAALLAVLVAGCTTLPREGSVHAVKPSATAGGEIGLSAQPPSEGATPDEIVMGFLNASAAGLYDDFAVARQFLSGTAASEWDPMAQVRVYPDTQNVQRTSTDTGAIRVSVGALGTLSSDGVFSESAGDATVTTDFSLAKNADGQWRIVNLSDGIFLSEHLFSSLYTAAPLYFLSADSNALVADLHWYPRRSFATLAVQGLLDGPSSWLENGVSTAFPEGTTLSNSVTVTDGTAKVDLSADVLSATESQRAYFLAQLRRTLTTSTSIKQVEVTVKGTQLTVDSIPDLATYPFGSYSLSVLADGVPASIVDSEAVPVMDNAELAQLELTDLAVGYQDSSPIYAALARNGGELIRLDTQENSWQSIAQGSSLIHPSFDSFGWIFSGETANQGGLAAYGSDGTVVSLSAPWLRGAMIRDIAVSREASRIVVICEVGGDVVAYVASIARSETGVPTGIGDPIRIGQRLSDITDIAWISTTDIVALGSTAAGSDEGLYTVTIGGPMESLGSPFSGTVAITAGRDEQSIAALTSLGVAVGLTGRAWTSLVEGVSAVAYPG